MTLHHIPDTGEALRNFHHWLVPGGHLCIADLDAEDGSFHNQDDSVHHGFDRAVLQQQAEAAGFVNIRYANVFCIKKGTPEKEYPVFLLMADKL